MPQNFNFEGIKYFVLSTLFKKSLSIPHFSVENIGDIDPIKLKKYGFKGVIFDKDNTLTAPYVNQIHPKIKDSFKEYQSVFENKIVIMSNFAGTKDDVYYHEARETEKNLGIRVLRNNKKKPYGIESVINYFNCKPEELVIFGDRIFTDILFGNRYGLLTIHTNLLVEKGDNWLESKIRKYGSSLVEKRKLSGMSAPKHPYYNLDIKRGIKNA